MKILKTAIVAIALLIPFSISAQSVESLWRDYRKAEESDKPKTQLEILGKIKTVAASRQLPWDYYDAATRSCNVGSRMNWRLRDSLSRHLREEILRYDLPLMVVRYMEEWEYVQSDSLISFIVANKSRMLGTSTSAAPILGEDAMFANDYESALAVLVKDRRDKTAASLLLKEVKGRRDLEAWTEYGVVEYRKEPLEALVKKYSGTQSAYRAQLVILYIKLSELDRSGAGQEKYRALRDEARSLVKNCKDAQHLVAHLESKDVEASARDRVLELRLRNVGSLKVRMTDTSGKEVWKTKIDNATQSFYVRDTVRVDIPEVSDGEYYFQIDFASKEQQSVYYEQYTLSAAWGVVESGLYVAHYLTGRPVEGFSVEKRESGFVRARLVNPNGTVWLSRDVSTKSPSPAGTYKTATGTIMSDCAAYHPGDTVRYKLVGFEEDRTMGEGQTLVLNVYDADGKTVFTRKHSTNQFGSASGKFVLGEGGKYGLYRLSLNSGNKWLANSHIYVGEHVLPTFDIVLKRQTEYLFKGDTVRFEGKVNTYSGRNFSAADAVCTIDGEIDGQYSHSARPLEIAADGSFCVEVVGVSRYVSASFDITDSTGESKSAWGNASISEKPDMRVAFPEAQDKVLGDNVLKMDFFTTYPVEAMRYRIMDSSSCEIASGLVSGKSETIALPNRSGLYKVEAWCEHRGRKSPVSESQLAVVLPGADSFPDKLESFIIPRGSLSCQLGSTTADLWAVVGLYDQKGSLIRNEAVHLVGRPGAEGSIRTVSFARPASVTGPLTISVFWFRDASSRHWTHVYEEEILSQSVPLSFSSFTDRTSPGARTSFTLKTSPDAEVAISIYNKSIDAIQRLYWNTVMPAAAPVTYPAFNAVAGCSGSRWPRYATMLKSTNAARMDCYVEEEALAVDIMDVKEMAVGDAAEPDVQVRTELLDAIAFEPALYPDGNGLLSYTFTPSDKLSTYTVKAYAHNRQRNSSTLQKDFTIFLPVEVSLAVPSFLYSGDEYSLRAVVSASGEADIAEGYLSLVAYDAPDGKGSELMRQTVRLSLEKGVAEHVFDHMEVPSCASGSISFKLAFVATDGSGNRVSDGILCGCPVYPPMKMMTESHSSLFVPSMDRFSVVEKLKSEFTNLPSDGAVLSERRISDMLGEVLSTEAQPRWDDAVSIMEAVAVRCLSAKLSGTSPKSDSLVTRLLALRGSDGGFSWRAEMPSSAYVTAYVLSAAADLRYRDCLPSELADLSSSVRYLDAAFFNPEKIWYSLPEDLYCLVRSQYAEVQLKEKTSASKRAALKKYLTHKDDKYYTGAVMLKARRVLSIDALTSSEEGLALAKAWGLKLFTSSRLASTVRKDVASLSEYAQKHPSGGIFFPNAVMPFRGLLESELSAHVLLIRVFESRDASIAEGVRLWIMLQKETQKWERDPECVLACAAVMDGSPALLDTRILTLTATEEQPFGEVKAASNGMSVSTRWMVLKGSKWVPLSEGTVLSAGEKLRGEYSIFSEQNRSFVMFEAPRPACLQPVEQRSGYQWFSMYGLYRDVRRECSQYWFDVLPEDRYTIVEDFVVSQSGVFQSPAAQIQCLYAPHWMANEDARKAVSVR